MKAPKQRRAPAARPQEIIDAALAQFVETGFAGTRLDDVAGRAGLSKAAIYLYFEDKTALFKGVVQHAVGSNLGTVEAMLAGHRGPVAPMLPRILEFMANRIEDTPMAAVAKLVIAESRAFPEIGQLLSEGSDRPRPAVDGRADRARHRPGRVPQGRSASLTVRSMMGPMLLAIVWRTVFEPIGAEKLDVQRAGPPSRRPDAARAAARRGRAQHETRALIAVAGLVAALLVCLRRWGDRLLRAGRHRRRRRPLSRLCRGRDQPDRAADRRPADRAAGRSRRAGSRRATGCSSSIPSPPRPRSRAPRRRSPRPRRGTRTC